MSLFRLRTNNIRTNNLFVSIKYRITFVEQIERIMKNQLHYVIFDGTSHFVGDLDDYLSDKDYQAVGTYSNIDKAQNVCDILNKESC